MCTAMKKNKQSSFKEKLDQLTSGLPDKKINKLVYELYRLVEEEVAIVEGKGNKVDQKKYFKKFE